jgi:hypothetical protein
MELFLKVFGCILLLWGCFILIGQTRKLRKEKQREFDA